MKTSANIRVRRWLSFALFAVLLGAQSAQAGHFHADILFSDDCMQCLVDCGQALKPSSSQTTITTTPSSYFRPAVLPAVFSAHYRLAARGPPPHSC